MGIKKWTFLLSYAIYLIFCIVFTIVSKNVKAINSMIFAITITSTAFSISDIFFTKIELEKKERKEWYKLNNINKAQSKEYLKIYDFIDMLIEVFKEDNDLIIKIFKRSLSPEEKRDVINKLEAYRNGELKKILIPILKFDNNTMEDYQKDYIDQLLNRQKKKEKIEFYIASSIVVLGFAILLIILTARINIIPYINNTLTVVAFLSLIINLILKNYYKANSIKSIKKEKKNLVNNVRN